MEGSKWWSCGMVVVNPEKYIDASGMRWLSFGQGIIWIHLATQLVASHHMAVGWLYDWAVGQKGCVDSCSPWECVLSLRFQHLTLIDLHQLEGWWLWTAHKIQYDATPSLNFKIRMNCKCASCLQPGSEKHGVSASNLKSKSTWSLSRRILLHFRFTRLGFLHLLAILQNWWKRMLHVCTVFARISQSFLFLDPKAYAFMEASMYFSRSNPKKLRQRVPRRWPPQRQLIRSFGCNKKRGQVGGWKSTGRQAAGRQELSISDY